MKALSILFFTCATLGMIIPSQIPAQPIEIDPDYPEFDLRFGERETETASRHSPLMALLSEQEWSLLAGVG